MKISISWGLLAIGLTLPLSCGPDPSGTVAVRVLAPNELGEYTLTTRNVKGVESIRQLRSQRFDFRANSATALGLEKRTYDRGGPFTLNYHLDDGVVVADDDQSAEALTVFSHLNEAAEYFISNGAPESERMNVFYYLRNNDFFLGDIRALQTDNAAFSPLLNSFHVFPQLLSKEIPLHENLGVMGHEYGHSIVRHLLWPDGMSISEIGIRPDFRAANEAIADLFGLSLTGQSDFFRASLGPFSILNRDLAEPLTYPQAEFDSIPATNKNAQKFDPHAHGAFVARAVYESLPKESNGTVSITTRSLLVQRIVGALQSQPFDERNSLSRFANAYLQQLGADERVSACEIFQLRLAPLAPFEVCP